MPVASVPSIGSGAMAAPRQGPRILERHTAPPYHLAPVHHIPNAHANDQGSPPLARSGARHSAERNRDFQQSTQTPTLLTRPMSGPGRSNYVLTHGYPQASALRRRSVHPCHPYIRPVKRFWQGGLAPLDRDTTRWDVVSGWSTATAMTVGAPPPRPWPRVVRRNSCLVISDCFQASTALTGGGSAGHGLLYFYHRASQCMESVLTPFEAIWYTALGRDCAWGHPRRFLGPGGTRLPARKILGFTWTQPANPRGALKWRPEPPPPTPSDP